MLEILLICFLALTAVGVLIVLLCLYFQSKIDKLKLKNSRLTWEKNEMSRIIRMSNIKEIPPKDLDVQKQKR